MHRIRTATVGVLLAVATGAASTACSADGGDGTTALPTSSSGAPSSAPAVPSSPAGASEAPATTPPTGDATATPTATPTATSGTASTPKPRRPSGIPKTPTDPKRTAGMIDGVITRGGDGPCFGLVTFDGVEYAIYAEDAPTLGKGVQIEAKVTPARLRIDCGSGTQVQAESVRVLG